MLRALLLALAKSSRLRRWITSNGATRRMARRFVPGEELAPAIEAARACNKAGMTVSLDHLGENVVTREDAERARASYTEALDQIAAAGDRGKRLAEADASRPRSRRGILRRTIAHRHEPRGGTRKFRARGYGRLGLYGPHAAHGQAGPRGITRRGNRHPGVSLPERGRYSRFAGHRLPHSPRQRAHTKSPRGSPFAARKMSTQILSS